MLLDATAPRGGPGAGPGESIDGIIPAGLDHSQLSLQNSFEAYFAQRGAEGSNAVPSSAASFHNRLGLGYPPAPLPDAQLTRGQILVHELGASSSGRGTTSQAEALQNSAALLKNLQAIMACHNLGPLAASAGAAQ
jgi:hypothetical protein